MYSLICISLLHSFMLDIRSDIAKKRTDWKWTNTIGWISLVFFVLPFIWFFTSYSSSQVLGHGEGLCFWSVFLWAHPRSLLPLLYSSPLARWFWGLVACVILLAEVLALFYLYPYVFPGEAFDPYASVAGLSIGFTVMFLFVSSGGLLITYTLHRKRQLLG